MAGAKLPKVKTPAQMKAEMAVGRARTVLPKEERDINLGNMLKESAVKERLYHGTTKTDDYADIDDQPFTQFTGRPTWLAQEPYTAEGYSKNTGSSYPVYSQIKNPLVIGFDANDDAAKAFPLAKQLGVDVDHLKMMNMPERAYEVINNPSFVDAAARAGYDGFAINEGGYKTYGVFDPSKIKSAIGNQGTYDTTNPDITKAHGGIVKMAEGGTPEQEFIDRMREEFSVYNKPTYGNEIPGTPTIDQQRYELTRQGQREAEGRSRMNPKDIAALAYPSAGIDALKTIGKSMVALPAYGAANAFDWLQTGKMDPARAKQRGQQIEEWIAPKTEEGGELLEDIGKIAPAITGSEMGFGMHPNLWVSGIGMTTPKQTAAGLRLGKERITPFAKDVGSMASELYESGRMPGMVAPNLYAAAPDGKPAKVLAPANESGFYSPTEAAALNLQRKSGAGQAFLNDIMKGENVRADEIKTMGLDTFLKDKKNVTADEVRDYIAQNKTQLGESVYGDPNILYKKNAEIKSKIDDVAAKHGLKEVDYGEFQDATGDRATNLPDDLKDLLKERAANRNLSAPTAKFSDYALPGGENYREIVLTLPLENKTALEAAQIKAGDLRRQTADLMVQWRELSDVSKPGDPAVLDAYQKVAESRKLRDQAEAEAMKIRKEVGGKTYRSSHWDEPNALAHIRVSDRVTDGKKTLLIDEVQSDWHQAGREKGYKGNVDTAGWTVKNIDENDPNRVGVFDSNGKEIWSGNAFGTDRQIIEKIGTTSNAEKVPDAPYKDDWYQLSLRRAIKEAIDGGYDRVALPTGDRVNERFDISKQVESISHQKNPDGTYKIVAVDKNNRHAMNEESVSEDKLSSIVGKDIAQKIINAEGKPFPKGSVGEGMTKLSGLDLKVGGAGNKKYYDEVYPNYLKKFGKKYGAKVGETEVTIPHKYTDEELGQMFDSEGRIGESYTDFVYRVRDQGKPEPVRYMEITPEMRKEFSTGIPMKRGGKVQFANNIDAMRFALSKG